MTNITLPESQVVIMIGIQLLLFITLNQLLISTHGLQSAWTFRTDNDDQEFHTFPNFLYDGSSVSVRVECSAKSEGTLTATWLFREVECMEDLYRPLNDTGLLLQVGFDAAAAEDANFRVRRQIPTGGASDPNDTFAASAPLPLPDERQPPPEYPQFEPLPDVKEYLPDEGGELATFPSVELPTDVTVAGHRLPADRHQPPNVKPKAASDTAAPRLRKVFYQFSQGQTVKCRKFGESVELNVVGLKDESMMPYKLAYVPETIRFIDKFSTAKIHSETIERPPRKNDSFRSRWGVTQAWEPGMYQFVIQFKPTDEKDKNFNYIAKVTVEMHSEFGYLSAMDFPLLPYAILMALFYLVLSSTWMIFWARSHQHSQKIHVIMGAITVAGAMCYTLLFIEYATMNSNGTGEAPILWFARLLHACQVSLFSLLLMTVSTGFMISRPKLEKKMVVAMVVLAVLQFFFTFFWVTVQDADLHIQYTHPTATKVILWIRSSVMLVIAGWVLLHSIWTSNDLWKRRYSSKFRVFLAFMIGCVTAFLAQLLLFGLSMGWMQACRRHWQYTWVLSSLGPVIDLVLLILLMWLWRPMDIAQTYSFAPIAADENEVVDTEEEEEEEGEKEKIKLDPL